MFMSFLMSLLSFGFECFTAELHYGQLVKAAKLSAVHTPAGTSPGQRHYSQSAQSERGGHGPAPGEAGRAYRLTADGARL